MTHIPRTVIAFGVSVAVLSTAPAGIGQPALRLSVDEYPRVDGSTSAQPLGMLLACRLTQTSFAWVSSLFDRTRTLAPTGEPYDASRRLSLEVDKAAPAGLGPLAMMGPASTLADRVTHTGTHQSYARLAAGEVDLILVGPRAHRGRARRCPAAWS